MMYQNTIYICISWYSKICLFPVKITDVGRTQEVQKSPSWTGLRWITVSYAVYRDFKNFSNQQFWTELVKELNENNVGASQFKLFEILYVSGFWINWHLQKEYFKELSVFLYNYRSAKNYNDPFEVMQ